MGYKTNLVETIGNLLEGVDLEGILKSAIPGPLGMIIRPAINSITPDLPAWLARLDENADAQAMILLIARNLVEAGERDTVDKVGGENDSAHPDG